MLTPAQLLFCASLFGVVVGGAGYQTGKKVGVKRSIIASSVSKPAPKPEFSLDTGRSIINVWSTPPVASGVICPDFSSGVGAPDFSLDKDIPALQRGATGAKGGNGVVTVPTPDFPSVVNPPVVPEPSAWAMMTIGFGSIGLSLRRRLRTTERVRQ